MPVADKLAAQQQIQLSSYQAGLNVNLHMLILFVYPHNMVHNSLIYYIAMGLSKLDSRKPQVCFQQVLRNNVKDQIWISQISFPKGAISLNPDFK